ncbi:MAG: phosphate signaling complex protein PhoU [Anaerolineae bacterium]|nr:phosphate signaling complex protein PhoU [Anaerolineae bacterium]
MVATTRSTFDRQLEALTTDVLALAELVETQLVDAVRALQDRDVERARRVAEFDSQINQKRYEIEEAAYTLMALQGPMARDMRRIVSTVSFVTNLERMGDHAAGVARLVIRMHEECKCTLEYTQFTEMATLAVVNLRDAMQALKNQDTVLAEAVIARDDQIDALHQSAYNTLLKEMTVNSEIIECATMMLWVSHNLERYADRISNICDRVLFMVTGDLHQPRRDQMP